MHQRYKHSSHISNVWHVLYFNGSVFVYFLQDVQDLRHTLGFWENTILEVNLVSNSNFYNWVQTKLQTPDQHQPIFLWKNTKLGHCGSEETVILKCDTACAWESEGWSHLLCDFSAGSHRQITKYCSDAGAQHQCRLVESGYVQNISSHIYRICTLHRTLNSEKQWNSAVKVQRTRQDKATYLHMQSWHSHN